MGTECPDVLVNNKPGKKVMDGHGRMEGRVVGRVLTNQLWKVLSNLCSFFIVFVVC